jgi:hypothetical protein
MPDAKTKMAFRMQADGVGALQGDRPRTGWPAVLSWLGYSRQSPQGEARRLQDLVDALVVHDRRYFIDDIHYSLTPTPVTDHRHPLR